MSYYGRDLATVHDRHFGQVAAAAADELLPRLHAAGFRSGTIAELGVGSGILSRRMVQAGFEAWGVDVSPHMVHLAREALPEGAFQQGSLWDVRLPPCVAVAAVGEAFCHAADPRGDREALSSRLRTIYAALEPGGYLIFDVASPGRSGAERRRTVLSAFPGAYVSMIEVEAANTPELSREITSFVVEGDTGLYRRSDERHFLRLFEPELVEELLEGADFEWQRLPGYGTHELGVGWHAFLAQRPADARGTTVRTSLDVSS